MASGAREMCIMQNVQYMYIAYYLSTTEHVLQLINNIEKRKFCIVHLHSKIEWLFCLVEYFV